MTPGSLKPGEVRYIDMPFPVRMTNTMGHPGGFECGGIYFVKAVSLISCDCQEEGPEIHIGYLCEDMDADGVFSCQYDFENVVEGVGFP